MAVDNFIKGKKYELEWHDELYYLSFTIPCSKLKIYYGLGYTAEWTQKVVFNKPENYGFNYYSVSENEGGNDDFLVADTDGDVGVEKIEFVFDYNENSNTTDAPNNIKQYCNLVSKKPLVSIWFDENEEWIDLPCQSDYTGSSSTLVDSGRNTQGQVVGSVIASDIAKVELKWNFLTAGQYSIIAKLFEPKYDGSFFVAVSFFDTIKNDWDGDNTKTPTNKDGNNPCRVFYCGDRKVAFAKMVLNDDGTPKGYSNVALNLIDTGKYYGE